ncbi:MAG: sulfotransferase [Rhodospirillaceae bacterium]
MINPALPFFCSGLAKSGTTFLQRMLDAHPQISCPSEHAFRTVFENLNAFYDAYNEGLELVARRTGGQKPRVVSKKAIRQMFVMHLQVMAKDASQGKPIFGLNDNALLQNYALFAKMFPRAKFLFIVRNPIDRALSLWDHNHKLFEIEKSDVHLRFLKSFDGTLDGCVIDIASRDAKCFTTFLDAVGDNQNALIIKYEDLSHDRVTGLGRIYDFLGATTAPDVLQMIAAESDIGTMAKASNSQGFF